jgi:FkbM family methyltransferase
MKKILVFGAGRTFKNNQKYINDHYNIIGLIDNDNGKHGKTIYDHVVFSPSDIPGLEHDSILIVSEYFWIDMVKELIAIQIPDVKIDLRFMCRLLCISEMWVDGKIIATNASITAIIENINDIYILNEITNTGEYNIYGFDRSVVIDVGMNKGIASMHFAAMNDVDIVYAFEPFKSTYKMALRNFSLNPKEIVDKIKPYNFGLGKHDEERVINIVNLDATGDNSTVIPNDEYPDCYINSDSKCDINVSVIIKNAATEVKSIIEANTGKQIICKIDTEGSEYEIIDILSKRGVIEHIDIFLIEYHIINGFNPDALIEALLRNDFYIFRSKPLEANCGMIRAVRRTCSREKVIT